MKKGLFVTAALAATSSAALAQAPTNAELYEIIQAQQSQLEALQGNDKGGFASAFARTSLGGYGELHYNNIKDGRDEIDFHRFVLFVNHEFTDSIRLFTELELEHALADDSGKGEVELEQAYIEFDINKNLQAKGGLFLVPVGILNETHEPPTFYGVERNNVENKIIPTTWWEAGFGINGRTDGGFSWDFAVHSGLNIPTGKTAIRDGRQKVARATADDPAATARIRYTGINGLDIAATLQYQADVTQGADANGDASAILLQTHAIYQAGNTKLTAFYATWDIDNATFEAAGADEQTGYYLEASQKLCQNVGVFARFSEWDNAAGAGDNQETAFDEQMIGVNYWPHENVVVKADIFVQDDQSTAQSKDKEGFNLGIGYQF